MWRHQEVVVKGRVTWKFWIEQLVEGTYKFWVIINLEEQIFSFSNPKRHRAKIFCLSFFQNFNFKMDAFSPEMFSNMIGRSYFHVATELKKDQTIRQVFNFKNEDDKGFCQFSYGTKREINSMVWRTFLLLTKSTHLANTYLPFGKWANISWHC